MEAPIIVYIEVYKYMKCSEAQKRATHKYFQKPEVKEKRRAYAKQKYLEKKQAKLNALSMISDSTTQGDKEDSTKLI